MEPVSLATVFFIFKVIGTITTACGFLFGVFKLIMWIKNKFVNIDANVTALKSTMETGFTNLSNDIKAQTTTIASELREQRQDFRTFYAPTLLAMQQAVQQPIAAPARARRRKKDLTK